MRVHLTRRRAIASTVSSLAALALVGATPLTAQVDGAPTLIMFHVEEGW